MNESISDSVDIEKVSWRDFIQLTKPGIIRSNLIAAFGGFWLASQWDINWFIFAYMMLGTALIMASGCVLNNFLDRDFDEKMERTKGRSLPAGRIHPRVVLWYGIALGIIGLLVLYFLVNPISALLGFIGFFVYVFVYTMWLKRSSTWSTSIGGISGAMPPVLGYCAVTNEVDAGAWLLFALLFLWQPPHFWALGIRRKEEYRAAGFPLLPVVKGVKRTKIQMLPYVLLLIPVNIMFYVFGYVGMFYLIVSNLLSIIWFIYCIAGFVTKDDDKWARKTFLFSINYLMINFLVMIINTTS
ncbi:heme o synthase [Chengkuizengella sp. SCS-71B]|uniref:heme o synthase n=1 Tax=Chengkuizengella sp. SCS-71B TaxID=3115290 RepID=UPI0032C24B5E